MKKTLLVAVLAILTVTLLLTGCSTKAISEYDVNILNTSENQDYTFKYDSMEALRAEWDLAGGASTSSIFSINNGTLKMNTASAGYAIASQKLYLKPYSYYKVSYSYSTSSMSNYKDDVTYVGLFVGFLEDKEFNNSGGKDTQARGKDTNGVAEFFFHTDGNREYNIAIFLGTEENPVNATANIKKFTVTRVTEATAVKESGSSAMYELKSDIYGKPSELNLVYVIIGAIGTLLIGYVFYALRSRSLAFDGVASENKFFNAIRDKKWVGITLTLSVAAFVRLLITLVETIVAGSAAVNTTYFGFNIEQLAAAGNWMAEHGTPYFLQYNAAYSLMPVQLYIAALAGGIGQLINLIPSVQAETVALTVICVIKLFTIAADLGTIALIYKIIEKRQGSVGATIMASLYALVPATFAMSACWGAIESITALLIVATFYCVLEKNYVGMAIAYFLACMTSTSAIYAVPAVAFYTVYLIFLAFKNKEYKKLIAPACCIVGGFVAFYLISLPFVFNEVAKGEAMIAFEKFAEVLKITTNYTENAFNFQAMLGNNFTAITTQSTFITILFIAFIVGILAFAYIRSRNRLDLTLIAVAFIVLMWTFGNKMNETTMFIALPLLFIVAALLKETRLYIAFVAYASIMFTNVSYVYLVAGYSADGITNISNETTAVMYVMGAFALLAIIYFIIVAYDILVSKKAVSHYEMNLPYGQYVKLVTKNVMISMRNAKAKTKVVFEAIGESIKEDAQKRKEKRANKKAESSEEFEEEDK